MVSARMWRAPFQRLVYARDAFFRVDKRRGKCFERNAGRLLIPKIVSQRFQAFFTSDHGLGSALGLVRKIEVFELALIECFLDAGFQLIG
jgi:hypothetical protein